MMFPLLSARRPQEASDHGGPDPLRVFRTPRRKGIAPTVEVTTRNAAGVIPEALGA